MSGALVSQASCYLFFMHCSKTVTSSKTGMLTHVAGAFSVRASIQPVMRPARQRGRSHCQPQRFLHLAYDVQLRLFCFNYLSSNQARQRRYEQRRQLIELAIQPDHVHLFVRTTPSTLPSGISRLIKGRSLRLLCQEFAHLRTLPALFSPSSFLSTAGNVSSQTIERFIQQHSEN